LVNLALDAGAVQQMEKLWFAEAPPNRGHSVSNRHMVEAKKSSPAPERGSGHSSAAQVRNNHGSARDAVAGAKQKHNRRGGQVMRHLADKYHINTLIAKGRCSSARQGRRDASFICEGGRYSI
jgi:hypothetical protein